MIDAELMNISLYTTAAIIMAGLNKTGSRQIFTYTDGTSDVVDCLYNK